MKKIIMDSFNHGKKGKATFERVSRWITVKHNYNPNKNNSLWDYVTDGDGYNSYDENFQKRDKELYLDYFTWNGQNYAIGQFFLLGSMCINEQYSFTENGETYYLSAVDMDNLYNPIYIECDLYGEHGRVYVKLSQIDLVESDNGEVTVESVA